MRIISIILSIIAFIGSIYSYRKTCKVERELEHRIEELDNSVFQWMKEDFNSKVDAKTIVECEECVETDDKFCDIHDIYGAEWCSLGRTNDGISDEGSLL